MTHPLRLEYEGAPYHIRVLGSERKNVYSANAD
jgi:hypothetical protein